MSSKDIGSLRTRLSWEDEGASASMTGFKRDLKGLRSEMNLARSGGKQYSQSLKGMREQSDILTRRFKTQQQQARELSQRYQQLVRDGKENTVEAKNIQSQYNNTTAQMKRTEEQLKRMNAAIEEQTNPWKRLGRSMDETGKKMQNIGRSMAGAGRTLTTRVTLPLVGLAGAALKVGMDFQEGMSKVQAISGATASEMEMLESQAREMGSTTVFSAKEAADGMSFLAQAGFDVNEITETMPGLLDLAASSGMELGRAADLVSNVLSGFGYEASEAGRLSDVFAKGASTANTSVEQLGTAMEVVAPIADMVGLEIEGLTAGVGKMSDAGIQGQQAGRMLRQGILRLAKPTGAASDLIEELGINVFDADGNMKDLDKVVGELNKGLEGMDSQAQAAALATIFGSESTAGWSALLKVGEKDLKDYTTELENSEGAAAEMAAIMQDNAKGALKQFKSAAEEAGIALSAHMLPAITDAVVFATDLTKKFGELDDSTQKNILKFGALAAAIGPALLVVGNLTTGLGGLMRVGGAVSRMIGVASGTGMLGAMSGLTATGVAGLAVAGVAGLAYGLKKLHDRSVEAKEVNLELAESLVDQANKLDALTIEYDKLSEKSKLTNDEFGRMIDIQQELENTQNPAKVAELQKEYDNLKKESGLTNAEIDKMIGLNNDIIEQSPEVESSFTSKGNAVLESTDAVKGYVNSLRDMALEELKIEQAKAFEKRNELLKEEERLTREITDINEKMNQLVEARNIPLEKVDERLAEIQRKQDTGLLTAEEHNALSEEAAILGVVQSGLVAETLESSQGIKKELQDKLNLNDEELAKLGLVNEQMAEAYLKEVDINYEKGEGLNTLDKEIVKLEKSREEIEKNTSSEQKKTQEYRDQIEKIDETIRQHESVRDKILEQTGYQSEQNQKLEKQKQINENINSVVDNNLKKLDNKARKEVESLAKNTEIKIEQGNIVQQVREQNSQHDEVIKRLKTEKDENGNITAENQRTIDKLNGKKSENLQIIKQITQEYGLWDDIKKEIEAGDKKIQGQRSSVMQVRSAGERVWDQIIKNNSATSTGIGLEKDRSTEAGRNVRKDIDVVPSYDPFDLSRDLSKKDKKEVDLTMNPINKKFSIPFFSHAQGTGPAGHPGGLAQLNDGVGSNAGQELVKTPDGRMGMFEGRNVFVDLPKGSHVLSARETRKTIPKYAHGTKGAGAEVGFKGIKDGFGSFLKGTVSSIFKGVGFNALSFLRDNLTSNLSNVFSAMGTVGKPAFKWPITSQFGYRTHPIHGGRRLHAGTDYGAPSGSPIPSTGGGVVSSAGWGGGYGNLVKVKNGAWEMFYAHMSSIAVKAGQKVNKGTILGRVGSTGNSTGPHLHYETRKNGRPVNPLRSYARGTKNHPGGMFQAGEEGWELGKLGNHWEFLPHGLYDRPRGYEVFSHSESKKLAKAMQNMPSYSKGTSRSKSSSSSGNDSLLNATLEQNEILTQILAKETNITIDKNDMTDTVNDVNARNSIGKIFV